MPVRRIGLREAIQKVLENSLDVKVEWTNWAIANEQVLAASGRFDPYYYFDASYLDSRLPQNALDFAQTGGVFVPVNQPFLFQQQNAVAGMGLAGRLTTGALYTVFTNAARYRNDLNRLRPPALYYPEYAATAGISLVQPLLRDFGPNAQLAEVRITRRNRAIADYKWQVQLQKILVEMILEYLDLNLVVANVAIKQEALGYAQNLSKEVSNLEREGKPADISSPEVVIAVSMAEEDLIKAMTLAAERQMKLKSQILGGAAEENGTVYLPRDRLRRIEINTNREQLLRLALSKRPDYLSTQEEIARQGILSKYMDNQKLPRLDLQATLSTSGLSGSFDSAYDRAVRRQGYEAQVGVRFSVPLGNRTAKANSATADYLHEQAKLNAARSELTVALEISNFIARVNGSSARLASVRKSQALSQDLLGRVPETNPQGVKNSFATLRARLQVLETKTREAEALVEYNKDAVQLLAASGLLLDHFGIHLEDRSAPTAAGVRP